MALSWELRRTSISYDFKTSNPLDLVELRKGGEHYCTGM